MQYQHPLCVLALPFLSQCLMKTWNKHLRSGTNYRMSRCVRLLPLFDQQCVFLISPHRVLSLPSATFHDLKKISPLVVDVIWGACVPQNMWLNEMRLILQRPRSCSQGRLIIRKAKLRKQFIVNLFQIFSKANTNPFKIWQITNHDRIVSVTSFAASA